MGVPSKDLAEPDSSSSSLPATQSFEFASDRIAKAFGDQRRKEQAAYSSREYKKAALAVSKMTLKELQGKYNVPEHSSSAADNYWTKFLVPNIQPVPSSQKAVKKEEEEEEKEVVPVHPWKRDRLRKIIMDDSCSKNTE